MKEFLKKLREKSPAEKRRMMIWGAAGAMFLVIGAWLALTPKFWKIKGPDTSLFRYAKESFGEMMNKYRSQKQ